MLHYSLRNQGSGFQIRSARKGVVSTWDLYLLCLYPIGEPPQSCSKIKFGLHHEYRRSTIRSTLRPRISVKSSRHRPQWVAVAIARDTQGSLSVMPALYLRAAAVERAGQAKGTKSTNQAAKDHARLIHAALPTTIWSGHNLCSSGTGRRWISNEEHQSTKTSRLVSAA